MVTTNPFIAAACDASGEVCALVPQREATAPAQADLLVACIRSGQVDATRTAELLSDPQVAAAYAA